MNKFVLAFPNRSGKNYQHYWIYIIDPVAGTVISDGTSFHNVMHLAERYSRWCPNQIANTLKHRISPKVNNREGLVLGKYVNNGKVSGCFHYSTRDEDRVEIRFSPVDVDYIDGGIIQGSGCNEYADEGSSLMIRHCRRTRWTTHEDEWLAKSEKDRKQLVNGMMELFGKMSKTQVRFVTGRRLGGPRITSIKDEMHSLLMHGYRSQDYFEDLLKIYPQKSELLPIKKSIERRLRRIPNATAATKKFLTMMAASSSLKNLFTRLRKANLTNETK